jgi:hypothetical protein
LSDHISRRCSASLPQNSRANSFPRVRMFEFAEVYQISKKMEGACKPTQDQPWHAKNGVKVWLTSSPML